MVDCMCGYADAEATYAQMLMEIMARWVWVIQASASMEVCKVCWILVVDRGWVGDLWWYAMWMWFLNFIASFERVCVLGKMLNALWNFVQLKF